jgi:hypothetical protein
MKTIVITSINHPTSQVKKWAKLSGYNLIVVGDNKSPVEYNVTNTKFLNISEQKSLFPEFAKVLPENHYCRKLMGYLYAANELKSEIIIDTDDDNLPLENWTDGLSLMYSEVKSLNDSWINIYKHYSEENIWPRGYPVQLDKSFNGRITKNSIKGVDISQGLVQGDPDVDAIFRLNNHIKSFLFNDSSPLFLSPINSFSPTNSQNTTFIKKFFSLLYLPSSVTFRYTDILRGYVLLSLKKKWNIKIGFRSADVYQDRNEHDLIIDLNSELPFFNDAYSIIDKMINNLESRSNNQIEDDIFFTYEFLEKEKVVHKTELKTLEEWLKAIN